MAKGFNQKMRLLVLIDIFNKYTDEDHGLSLEEIQKMLLQHDIKADRKTLYWDFETLNDYGMEIVKEKDGRTTYYKQVSRTFDLAELKFLVDSVQAAKFISEAKSKELIEKLSAPAMVSKYQADGLKRQVHINGRVKSINKSILLNVDKIHEAIRTGVQISFKYFQWNAEKKPEFKHGGELYFVSPWALIWSEENYYLVAFDSSAQKVKHFRVDKMAGMEVTALKQEGLKEKANFNVAEYATAAFGMYGGKRVTVTLEADEKLVGVIIDRFGKNVPMHKRPNNKVEVWADVMLSPQFFGWLAGFGTDMRVIQPPEAVEQMKELIEKLKNMY